MTDQNKPSQKITVYENIGPLRSELFEQLSDVQKAYGDGNNPDDAYQAWVDMLHAIWKFLLALEPPGNELAPLIGLSGALADLDVGLQPPALTKKTIAHRPPVSHNKVALMVQASVTIDWLIKEGMGKQEAGRKTLKAMRDNNLVDDSMILETLLNFRDKIHYRGELGIKIHKETTKMIQEIAPVGERGKFMLAILVKDPKTETS